MADPALAAALGQVDDFLNNGMKVRRSTQPEAFVEVVAAELIAPDQIALTFCRLDADVVVMAERIGDLEAVVDDRVTTRIWRGVMVRADGQWLFAGADVVSEAEGEVPCADLQ
jgi:hypothetical protein